MSRRVKFDDREYKVKNDITKEELQYKVTRVFAPEKKEYDS